MNIFSKINGLRYTQFSRKALIPSWYNKDNPYLQNSALRAEGYYSQAGQDKWVVESIFVGKNNGFFVDIGAHDGISFRNTYLLEQKGWLGIAVEPNPFVYPKLVKNRKCLTVNGCITDQSGIGKFRLLTGYSEMLSGLIEEYKPQQFTRIQKEMEEKGGELVDINVDCYTIMEILKNNHRNHIDYLSIDAEGAELKILNSVDFNAVSIHVISVENSYQDWRIPYTLINKGFVFHSIVGDEFYVNKKKFENSPFVISTF